VTTPGEPLVLAWRVFTVDADGVLLAPFAMRFGEDVPPDEWRTTITIASCITVDDDAPAEGSTADCGECRTSTSSSAGPTR
jgi:hypothetical protein